MASMHLPTHPEMSQHIQDKAVDNRDICAITQLNSY